MSEQQYAWMLGAFVAFRQLLDDDQDGPRKVDMARVSGVAGELQDYQEEAANEIAARLFIFLLILWWTSAKNRAKTLRKGADFCEINEAAFFSCIAAIPHQMAAAGFRALTQGSAKTITSPHLIDSL